MSEGDHLPASTIQVQPTDLDQKLADTLAEQLGCAVSIRVAESDGALEVVGRAVATPGRAQTEQHGATGFVALLLSAGGVAVWETDFQDMERSARHAETVLALHSAQTDKKLLQSEVDSLVAQVTNDFEELSLIRSLSCSIALPNRTQDGDDDMLMSTLLPLATGLGAESIAAVFCNSDETLLDPIWSHDELFPAEAIHSVIESERDEAEIQPVVRNGVRDHVIEGLNEYILVECRSESRIHGWLIACNRVANVIDDVPWAQVGFTTVQASLMETTTNQLSAYLHNLRLLKQKEDLFTDVVRALVNAVDARDPYTCGHSERVALFARCLATVSGQTQETCHRIYLSGLLHDVGKIGVPDYVLQKPSKLSPEERAIIETHTEAGWRVLTHLDHRQVGVADPAMRDPDEDLAAARLLHLDVIDQRQSIGSVQQCSAHRGLRFVVGAASLPRRRPSGALAPATTRAGARPLGSDLVTTPLTNPMAAATLYGVHDIEVVLVRHGQQIPPEDRTPEQRFDPPLSTIGERQVVAVAEHLADEEIDAVYSSHLERAHRTGLGIAGQHGLDVTVIEDLREIELFSAIPEGESWASMNARPRCRRPARPSSRPAAGPRSHTARPPRRSGSGSSGRCER